VIVSLLQNKFDGNGECSEDEFVSLSTHLSGKLGYSPAKIADVARQMRRTNYKRNWPKVISRLEIGLPQIKDIKL